MAVHLKSSRDIDGIRRAGRIAAQALERAGELVAPGVALRELEVLLNDLITSAGAHPTFLGYRGFPAAACISVNDEVVHGIPDSRRLSEGEIVKIDIGVTHGGYIADMARTFEVGGVEHEIHDLVVATEESFWSGFELARAGRRVGDISAAVQDCVESRGYSVVRALCGHAVGIELHEEPSVPNFGRRGRGMKLRPGMTLAIEPMVNIGREDVRTRDNGWTVVTADGSWSAHYENTVLVTDGKPEILSRV